jgi:hypothetical protein
MAMAKTISPWQLIELSGLGSYWYELQARMVSRNYGADGVRARRVALRPAHSGCGAFDDPPYTNIDITAVRVKDGYHLATKHYANWGCRQERWLPRRFRTHSPQGMVVYMWIGTIHTDAWPDYRHARTHWRLWQH